MNRWFRVPRSGQTIVLAAVAMSVFFGMAGLTVDLGVVMLHRRQQQNAADSVAFGVARMLAGSLASNANGTFTFVGVADDTVLSRAQTLASGNWIGPATSRTIGVEYLTCTGTLIRAATTGTTAVPSNTCRVRATGTSTMPTLLIRVLDPTRTSSTATAQATARIAPATSPTSVTGVWPITRELDHANSGSNCLGMGWTLCEFWGNNGGGGDTSIGSYKEKLYFSRYSQYYCPNSTVNNLGNNYDPFRVGSPCDSSSVKQTDTEYWMRNGFRGKLQLGAKVEVDASGVQGNNYAEAMQDYVNASPDGYDSYHSPSWGNYRDVHLVLWRKTQDASSPSTPWGAEYWKNSPAGFYSWTGSGTPDRVTISEIWCFRFYSVQSFTNSSEVWGNRLTCFEPPEDISGGSTDPPSAVANTVQMVD